jgi:hypothetical protein
MLATLRQPPAPGAALAANSAQHAVAITLSAHITSDSSGVLNLSGIGSHLGRWTGQAVIDNIIIDPAADQAAISATGTIVAANGDQLFISISVALNLTTHVGEETVTFTGGTGRFAGASGSVSGVCQTTWDPATPLLFECDSQGTGTLIFAH